MLTFVKIYNLNHTGMGTTKGKLVDVISVNVSNPLALSSVVAKVWKKGSEKKDFIYHYDVEAVDARVINAIKEYYNE